MKKLQIFSIIVLVITIVGFILWRFIIPFPDYLVRIIGILMLASVFTTVFSTVRVTMNKK